MGYMKTLEKIVDPHHSALIIVDAQQDFCSREGAMAKIKGLDVSRIEATIPRLNQFINSCRSFGTKVIWVRQMLCETRMLPNHKALLLDHNQRIWYDKVNTPGSDWYDSIVKPANDETVITKWSYDGFHDTDLDLVLRASNIKTLLMTGFTTGVCVETTARHGFFKGYYIVAVSDCTDAYTYEEYEAAMRIINMSFGYSANSREIVSMWGGNKY